MTAIRECVSVKLKTSIVRLSTLTAVAAAVLIACTGEQAPVQLGPVDGLDLAPTDLERVAVGTVAPDFSLAAMNDDTLTLSDYRGSRNVVLVFYRGHW